MYFFIITIFPILPQLQITLVPFLTHIATSATLMACLFFSIVATVDFFIQNCLRYTFKVKFCMEYSRRWGGNSSAPIAKSNGPRRSGHYSRRLVAINCLQALPPRQYSFVMQNKKSFAWNNQYVPITESKGHKNKRSDRYSRQSKQTNFSHLYFLVFQAKLHFLY